MARAAKKDVALTQKEKLAQALVPEAEQPYQVPENWCWVKQGCVSTFLNGRAYKQDELLKDSSFTPVLRVGNLFTNSSWYYSDLSLDNDKYIDANDLIYAWSASFGPFIWNGGHVIYHYHIWKILLSGALRKRYYYYWLMNDTERLKNQGHGTGMIHVTKEMMERSGMPLPPLAEQQRIVDRIESLFAKLDEAKEKAQSVVDGFEDRKAAILHKAFAGELTEKWRWKHGVNYESTWKEKTVVDLCSVIVDCPHSTPEWTESGKICLRTTNIKDGYLDLSEIQYVSEQTFLDRIQRAIPQAGDVLLIREGNIGDVGVIPEGVEICLGQRMMLLRPNECESNFLVYFFRSPRVTEIIKSNTMGSTAPRMNIKDIKQISMRCPSYEEQKVITCILDRLMKLEEKAKEAAEQVIDQIDTMKKAILARAFRGELGTNDLADESAEELLKRVL